MNTTNPYDSPKVGLSDKISPARERLGGRLVVWFLTGCVLGFFVIPDFGHPSGQANAGLGGIIGLALYSVWRLPLCLFRVAEYVVGFTPPAIAIVYNFLAFDGSLNRPFFVFIGAAVLGMTLARLLPRPKCPDCGTRLHVDRYPKEVPGTAEHRHQEVRDFTCNECGFRLKDR